MWVGSVVLDCRRWESMIAFWKEALGYEFARPPTQDWALLIDPRGAGPNLALQKDPEGPGAGYWFHIDLYAPDLDAEVRRLVDLGATVLQPAREGADYVTLADPDGNPFDVVATPGFRFGQRTD